MSNITRPIGKGRTICKHEPCKRPADNVRKGGEYCALHQRRIDKDLPIDFVFDKAKCQGASDCNRNVRNVLEGGIFCSVHLRRHNLGLPMDDPIIRGHNSKIYKLTHLITGKCRVGQSRTVLKERLRRYISAAWKYEGRDDSPLYKYFYKDIRDHIPRNAEIADAGNGAYEVAGVLLIVPLMVGIDNDDSLNASEDPFIQILDTMHPNGYNYKRGGGQMPARKYPSICGVEGCDKPHRRHGFCQKHGDKYQMFGDPLYEPEPRVKYYCEVDGCNNTCAKTRKYCRDHYDNWVEYGNPLGKRAAGKLTNQTLCKEEGCNELAEAKGWCTAHYQEWYHYGKIDPARKHKPKAICKERGCRRPVKARGVCKGCYQRSSTPRAVAARRRRKKERMARAFALREQGKTHREIALEVGVSESTVGDWLKRKPS